MPATIAFRLNDQPVSLAVDPDRPLLWVLRTELALTGTKYGCGEGHCGCCEVLVDHSAQRACLLAVKDVAGKNVTTIEGLEKDGQLHPLQKAFMAHDALQCGFCTPGMIMRAAGLLQANPHPSVDEIVRGMDSNFCRCGAHMRIIQAIQTAAAEMKGAS
jgi:aerobic-type carbon monoxide dehydrogenase small subunit (CoxS/CutS family)